MSERRLILVGGGGHCKAVIDVAVSVGRNVYGILDNNIATGSMVLGVPVIGGDDDIASVADENTEFVITVGQIKSSSIRRSIADRIRLAGGELASPLIASTAHIAIGAEIGKGSVVMHNATVNSDAKIGENCIINTGAIVEHDCSVGDFVHISTGAIVNGMSHIGNDCFVGSHTTVANVVKVAQGCIIGTGAVVIKDIAELGTYCGVPAKKMK